MTSNLTEDLGYKRNERKFQDIQRFFSQDHKSLRFDYAQDRTVYVGYESRINLPNITNLPNLETLDREIVMGSTFGHQHTQKEKGDKRGFQEIYDFLWYGGMFVRNKEAVLYLLRPNEKVIVGTDENMTILNFDAIALTTHDFANHDMNSANKELEGKIGTCLLAKYERKLCGFGFYINSKYYEEKLLDAKNSEPIIMKNVPFGRGLYEAMLSRKNEFADRGIKVVLGGNIPEKFKREFQKPLQVLIKEKNKALFDALQIKRQKVHDKIKDQINRESRR